MTELQRRASDEIRNAAPFYAEIWLDWYSHALALPQSLAFDHAIPERVAPRLDDPGETDATRLLRALRQILVDTTREVFRDNSPLERENRLAPETQESLA